VYAFVGNSASSSQAGVETRFLPWIPRVDLTLVVQPSLFGIVLGTVDAVAHIGLNYVFGSSNDDRSGLWRERDRVRCRAKPSRMFAFIKQEGDCSLSHRLLRPSHNNARNLREHGLCRFVLARRQGGDQK